MIKKILPPMDTENTDNERLVVVSRFFELTRVYVSILKWEGVRFYHFALLILNHLNNYKPHRCSSVRCGEQQLPNLRVEPFIGGNLKKVYYER